MSDETRRAYTTQATVLTLFFVALGGGFAKFLGMDIAALYLAILPFPLLLLWLSRDVPTLEERIAESDALRIAQKRRWAD